MRQWQGWAPVRGIVVCIGATVALSSVVASRDMPSTTSRSEVLALVVFMAAIAAGEVARLRILGRPESAPLSTAAGLALAMSTASEVGAARLTPSVILTAVASAMAVGALVQLALLRPVSLGPMSARYIGVAVATLLYRSVPFDGRALLDVSQS